MSALCTVLRTTISLLGMVAVLLGALEHESLVLTPDCAARSLAGDERVGSHGDSSDAYAQLGAIPHDSGTEGTFRAVFHFFRTAPGMNSLPAWQLHGSSVSSDCTGVPLHLVQQARFRHIGVIALRL